MNKPPKDTFSVKVPTKAYLRKYVHCRYGQPFPLNYNSTLGVLISSLLEKDFFTLNMNSMKKDVRLLQMNDAFEAVSPLKTMQYKGFSLTGDKIIAINRFLENAFVEEMHAYCRDNIKKRDWRPGREDAITSFAESLGIEVDSDISLDALKKAEWRFRKRREEKLQTFVLPQIGPAQFAFC